MMALVLAKSGLWLFLAGLLIGLAIPKFTSPRLALSAHVTALQSGTTLLALGWFWPQLTLGSALADLLGHALVVSFWMLCIGLALAAAWGANKVLPIAGAGYGATPVRERVTSGIIAIASVVMTLALGALLTLNAFSL